MAIGFFLDKEHQPSEEEIDQALGSSLPFWQHVIRFIDDSYAMPGPWSFGGKKYGWNRWYRQSGKSLVSLFPQKDYFVAQVVLGKDQVAQADQIELGSNVRPSWSRLRSSTMAAGCSFTPPASRMPWTLKPCSGSRKR